MFVVKFMGHATQRGVIVYSSKIEGIIKWEKPNIDAEVISFLELTDYYMNFFKKLSKIDLPLTRLNK